MPCAWKHCPHIISSQVFSVCTSTPRRWAGQLPPFYSPRNWGKVTCSRTHIWKEGTGIRTQGTSIPELVIRLLLFGREGGKEGAVDKCVWGLRPCSKHQGPERRCAGGCCAGGCCAGVCVWSQQSWCDVPDVPPPPGHTTLASNLIQKGSFPHLRSGNNNSFLLVSLWRWNVIISAKLAHNQSSWGFTVSIIITDTVQIDCVNTP